MEKIINSEPNKNHVPVPLEPLTFPIGTVQCEDYKLYSSIPERNSYMRTSTSSYEEYEEYKFKKKSDESNIFELNVENEHDYRLLPIMCVTFHLLLNSPLQMKTELIEFIYNDKLNNYESCVNLQNIYVTCDMMKKIMLKKKYIASAIYTFNDKFYCTNLQKFFSICGILNNLDNKLPCEIIKNFLKKNIQEWINVINLLCRQSMKILCFYIIESNKKTYSIISSSSDLTSPIEDVKNISNRFLTTENYFNTAKMYIIMEDYITNLNKIEINGDTYQSCFLENMEKTKKTFVLTVNQIKFPNGEMIFKQDGALKEIKYNDLEHIFKVAEPRYQRVKSITIKNKKKSKEKEKMTEEDDMIIYKDNELELLINVSLGMSKN